MRRFFIPVSQMNVDGSKAFLSGSDVHHITDVLRKKEGEEIDATDGQGNVLKAVILSIREGRVELDIRERKKIEERRIVLRLFQAIPKGGLFEEIIAKATELGVDDIVPVVTERTVLKYSEERGIKKLGRWERVVLETMKQTGRVTAPALHPTIPIKKIDSLLRQDSLKIFPWELEQDLCLKDLLDRNKDCINVELIIGPEGGFTLGEAEFLKSCGFQSVSLGKRILKVETAAISAISNIYYGLE